MQDSGGMAEEKGSHEKTWAWGIEQLCYIGWEKSTVMGALETAEFGPEKPQKC